MKYLSISFSMSLDKIGVTEIGRYSWQLWGFTTLGTSVMELVAVKQTKWIGYLVSSSTLILSCTVWFLSVVFLLSSCSCTYVHWFVVS